MLRTTPVKCLLLASLLLASLLLAMPGCGGKHAGTGGPPAEISGLQQRLEQLNTELERIEDIRAIKRLQRAYGYYVDRAWWDETADLFTADGRMELALSGVFEGKARIRQLLYTIGGGKAGLEYGQLNTHIQLQPVIHIAGDGLSAQGRWRSLILAGRYGDQALLGEGTYENEYRKENGVWKISKLHWYQTFIVPYAGGWGMNADATGGQVVGSGLTPDQPPTEIYDVWPGVYIPPFHYTNPVSGRAGTHTRDTD